MSLPNPFNNTLSVERTLPRRGLSGGLGGLAMPFYAREGFAQLKTIAGKQFKPPASGGDIAARARKRFIVPDMTPGRLNFLPMPQYIDTPSSSGLSTNQIIVLLLIAAAVYYYYNKNKTTFRIRRGFY